MRIIIICNRGQPPVRISRIDNKVTDNLYLIRVAEKMTVGNTNNSAESLDSKTLFKGRSCIFIEHNGELYSLRITSNDKLILTK